MNTIKSILADCLLCLSKTQRQTTGGKPVFNEILLAQAGFRRSHLYLKVKGFEECSFWLALRKYCIREDRVAECGRCFKTDHRLKTCLNIEFIKLRDFLYSVELFVQFVILHSRNPSTRPILYYDVGKLIILSFHF